MEKLPPRVIKAFHLLIMDAVCRLYPISQGIQSHQSSPQRFEPPHALISWNLKGKPDKHNMHRKQARRIRGQQDYCLATNSTEQAEENESSESPYLQLTQHAK